MSREEFVAEYLNEAVGLLVAAWSQTLPAHLSPEANEKTGRAVIDQMRRAREFLGRLYDRLRPEEVRPAAGPKPATIPMTRTKP